VSRSFWLCYLHVHTRHPRSYQGHLSTCPTHQGMYPGVEWWPVPVARRWQLASRQCLLEFAGLLGVSYAFQSNGCHWARHLVCKWRGASRINCSDVTRHKSSWQCAAQWSPCLWTPWDAPGWQAVCNSRRHEVSCHPLPTEIDMDFFYARTHVLAPWWYRFWNGSGN
jgi:hypothetical protein